MMKWIFGGLIVISVVFGALSGRIEEVSSAVLKESGNAVTLCISLIGSLCLWSGVMRVAQESGLTVKLSKLLSPVLKLLFNGLSVESQAFQAISMNITANMLGLGNAATPFGLQAMGHLGSMSDDKTTATTHMTMLVVLNTASIQIIPTTIAALRMTHGAVNPMDVFLPILTTSVMAACIGVVLVKISKRGSPCLL
ncbi:MAG: spore maturation protein A [Oscillospiraceae bacterium]|nr:spore maturation protein A [Oscillospiraceae bacterium]